MSFDLEIVTHAISIWSIPVLLAITLHEAAHGWVAHLLGNPTAKSLGRVSCNPFKHIDPFGTVLLPMALIFSGIPFLFGWAKPVPVGIRQLKNPRRDMALVAAAGPATNLALAWTSAMLPQLLFFLPYNASIWIAKNLERSVQINLILAVLNMLPLPSLDAGRVAVGILPNRLAIPLAKLEKFGLFILIGVLFIVTVLAQGAGLNFDIVGVLIGEPVIWLKNALFYVTGLQ